MRETVDVTIPTWNSAATLQRTLDSIRGDPTFPLGRLIVVDRASNDATVSIAQAAGATVLTDTVSLGSARQRAFAETRSEWAALIDSDIALPPGWFGEVSRWRATLENVGALQSLALPPHMDHGLPREDHLRRVVPQGPRPLEPRHRGYTYATLVRRELVSQLRLAHLDAYEDQAISEAVQSAGFTWWILPVVTRHHYDPSEVGRKARWNAAGRRLSGNFRGAQEFRATVGALREGVRDAFRYRDTRFLRDAVVINANAWMGYWRPHRFRRRRAA